MASVFYWAERNRNAAAEKIIAPPRRLLMRFLLGQLEGTGELSDEFDPPDHLLGVEMREAGDVVVGVLYAVDFILQDVELLIAGELADGAEDYVFVGGRNGYAAHDDFAGFAVLNAPLDFLGL